MTYDYFCPVCGAEIAVDHPMNERPDIHCPVCDKQMKIKITGGIGTIYKGTGWGGKGKKKDGYLIDKEKDLIRSGIKQDPYKQHRDEPL